ncbi:hypothetical protein L1887_11465 [Cichorium endivia]|nr:hypothetical protein L1887_11465 [Cichorium endivia]
MASSSKWTWAQNKLFENTLVTYNKDTLARWQNISNVTGKTVEEVKIHYQKLVDDVKAIEAGQIPLPDYESTEAKGCAQPEIRK